MFKNRILIGLVVVLSVLALAGTACSALQAATGQTGSANQGVVTRVTAAQSIKATGYIKALSSASLAWKTSGTVGAVRVKVGDQVQAGEVLLSLKTDSAPANIIAAEADLVGAKQALVNVQKSALALAQAQQAVAVAMKAVDDAQKDVTKLDYRRASDDVIKRTQDEIDMLKKQISDAESYYNLVKQHRPQGDSLRAQAEYTLITLRTQRDDKQRLLNWYTGRPDAIDEAKYLAALAVAQAQQADAQREVDRLINGPTADDVAAAQARVDAAQATIDTLNIVAPFAGEVLSIEQNPGEVVDPGTLALTIADRSKLHIDAQVDEADIAGVKVGNPATITLDAMPGSTLKGSVTYINPVGQTISGLIKYLVRVELDPLDTPMLLGATADAVIQVSDAQDTLAVPAGAVQNDKIGEFVNLVAADGSLSRVDVVSGAAVGNLIIVSGKLKEGDKVQLK